MSSTRHYTWGIRRIVALTLILICLVLNALGFLYVSREHKLIERTMSTMTMESSQTWARLCLVPLLAGDRARLQDLVDALSTERAVVRVMVSDQKGLVIAASDQELLDKPISPAHRVLIDAEVRVREEHPKPTGFFHETGHYFQYCLPIAQEEKRLASLFVTVNTAWGNQQARTLALKGLLALFFVTSAMVVAAIALDWRLRRAVKRLIEATQVIARGELSQRILVGTGDELDTLGDSVNQMAEALKESEQRIKHWHHQLEDTIAQRTQELAESQNLLAQREKAAALGLMAAGVAHEIGNPLAAMSAIMQRIEREARPELRDKCKVMRQQIERVSKIVNEIRQFARPATGHGMLVNVNEVLRIALKVCRHDPRARNIELVGDLDPEIPAVCGNSDRWQQVFFNLILNAFDAMPTGGRLTITSRSRQGFVEILFTDTGKGMNAHQVRNLFHPFYSTKEPGHGTGLGLSVCEGIVRSCGGEITVESKPGHGSAFRIIVPVGRPKAGRTFTPLPPSPGAREASSLSSRKPNPTREG